MGADKRNSEIWPQSYTTVMVRNLTPINRTSDRVSESDKWKIIIVFTALSYTMFSRVVSRSGLRTAGRRNLSVFERPNHIPAKRAKFYQWNTAGK